MLYIEYLVANHSKPVMVAWYVGTAVPQFLADHTVVFVQADGDELEHIRKRFANIPLSMNRVQIWRGDFAMFIAENL